MAAVALLLASLRVGLTLGSGALWLFQVNLGQFQSGRESFSWIWSMGQVALYVNRINTALERFLGKVDLYQESCETAAKDPFILTTVKPK